MTMFDQPTRQRIEFDVVVRPAERADLPKLEWFGQFEDYRNLFLRSFREHQAGKRLMLVADLNNFPVGRLFIQFFSENRNIANGYSRGYFYSFYVMEMFRSKGIGSMLLQSGEALLRKKRYEMATIAVAKNNKRALELYKRNGYLAFAESEGKWSYRDPQGTVHHVHEPCYLLEKHLC